MDGGNEAARHADPRRVESKDIMTNPTNITDGQIDQLKNEAAAAGDMEMVAVCARAFGWPVRRMSPAAGLSVVQARAECARVIADAEAQG